MALIFSIQACLKMRQADFRAPDGICESLKQCDPRATVSDIEPFFTEWPEYSGDEMYPVPHHDYDPEDGYKIADPEEMWSPDNPYGAARRRLLDFLIDQMTKKLIRDAINAIPDDYTDDLGVCAIISHSRPWPDGVKLQTKLFVLKVLRGLMLEWPEHSGDQQFPILTDPDGDPEKEFGDYEHTPVMWDRDHPYGAARWRLLNFLKEVLNEPGA